MPEKFWRLFFYWDAIQENPESAANCNTMY